MIYLSIILLLLYLSFYYDICGKKKYRDFWFRLILVVFILIAGLRWRLGVDTPNYIYNFYHEYPLLEDFSFKDYSLSQSPFFVLINSVVKTLGGRFYVVQLICATIVNGLIFKYIKKHTIYIFTSIFFYAILAYTNYNMEIMRGGLSIVISLFANDYFLNKKWLKGYILLIFALFFHPQTVVLFLFPLLYFLKFNKVGALFVIGAFFLGLIIMKLFGDYLWIFESDDNIQDKVQVYVNSEKYGVQSGGVGFYFVSLLMPIFYIVFSLLFVKKGFSENKLLLFEPLLMLGIIFIVIRANVNLAYRYIDYFTVYFCLFYSELFAGLIRRTWMLKRDVAYFRSFMIFLPLFMSVVFLKYFTADGQGYRYYPYTSVFDRKMDVQRQLRYNETTSTKHPYANEREY